jgi:hypothetical protein
MSNEIKIENTIRDYHMHEEIHNNERCHTEERDGLYIECTGRQERTLKVLVIFMVCHCGKKSRNPLLEFDRGQYIDLGESVDVHLPDKNCNYEPHSEYKDEKTAFWFECRCYCRNERVSYVR